MHIHRSRIFALVTVFAIAALSTGGGITASAQYNYDNYYPPTPPQGPPLASAAAPSIGIEAFITPEVYGRIDQAISDNNRCYNAVKSGAASCFRDQGVDDNDKCIWGCTKNGVFIPRPTSAAIITASKQRYSPWLAQTLYPDRPNEKQALITYSVVYNLSDIWGCSGVCFDYPFSRTVSQTIDLYIACQGWQTGTGALAVNTVVSPAYMDPNHSLTEDVLFGILWNNVIPAIVDSRIRAALSSFGGGTHSAQLGSSPMLCNRLGVFSDPNPRLEAVTFEYFPPLRIPPSFFQQITVRVTQIRRLTLHDLYGAVVRYPTEVPQLELYVGYSKIVLTPPPMIEGQTYLAPSTAVVSVPVPANQLIIIATMWDLSHYTRDPGFVVFDKNSNWGAGTRLLNTPKIWSEWNSFLRKPIIRRGSGYEVTLEITPPPTTYTTFTTF